MKSNSGFISMVLVVGVATILLAFTYAQSTETFHFFDLTLRKQYRLMNYYNAYNCIDRAILNLSHDYFYKVTEPSLISDLNCSIDSVRREGEEVVIHTSGIYKNVIIKREASVKLFDDRVEIIFIK